MKKIILAITLLALFALPLSGSAQETELPNPGITPDSPLYLFERILERISMVFAFGDLSKAEKYMLLSSERVAEAQAMAEKEKPEEAGVALRRYEKQLESALAKAQSARNKGEATEKTDKIIARSAMKHSEVLNEVAERVPEEGKEGIEQAINASTKGYKNALRGLAEENPEEATRINLQAMQTSLNRASKKAEENKPEKAEEAAQEFEDRYRFGEEISQTAQKTGKDITALEELVGKATSLHLEVLADVYERVPEQAKPAIEKAMETSLRGHERAVQSLQQKDALGEVPEEIPLSEQIPEEVRNRIQERMQEKAGDEVPREPGVPGEPRMPEEPGTPEQDKSPEEPGTPQEPDEEEALKEVELEITAMDGGITDPVPGTYSHEEGEEITVKANPAQGYKFTLWEREGSARNCEREERECTFQIEEDSMLSAHFTENGLVTECSADSECGWVSTNCCSENAGADWSCANKEETNIDCPSNPVCPQVISPKPTSSCVCTNGECQEG